MQKKTAADLAEPKAEDEQSFEEEIAVEQLVRQAEEHERVVEPPEVSIASAQTEVWLPSSVGLAGYRWGFGRGKIAEKKKPAKAKHAVEKLAKANHADVKPAKAKLAEEKLVEENQRRQCLQRRRPMRTPWSVRAARPRRLRSLRSRAGMCTSSPQMRLSFHPRCGLLCCL